jgi:hypothetical protein
MSDINVAAGEKIALVGTIDPATVANTEVFTDVVDMSKFLQCLGIALIGNIPAETVDFKAYSCDANGSNSVALKACTQLAANASTNDNTQLVISVRAEDLQASGKQHIRFGLVTGGATGGPCAAVALGVDARFGPASDSDLASVAQIKL